MNEIKSNGRILQGVVVSPAKDKTISVRVERKVTHPQYKKIIKRSTKVLVHVPDNLTCASGDEVRIQECRPISKNKSWVLLNVIEKAS